MTKYIFSFTFALAISCLASAVDLDGSFTFQQEYLKIKGIKARHRQRVKAYLTGNHTLNENAKVTIGLASGPTTPTSTYNTLGGSFSSMAVNLDQANAQLSTWKNQIHSTFGKMKDPFTRVGGSQLQWDSDVRPEGISLNFDNKEVVANLGGFVLQERPVDEDSLLFAGDVYFPIELNEKTSLKLGFGVFVYTQVRGKSTLFDNENTYGNSGTAIVGTTSTTYTYTEDYTLMNPGIELNTRLSNIPFKVYFDFVYNTEASNDNTGWTFGAQLGDVKGWKDFSVAAYFLRKEADAVLGALTDSNFYSQSTGTQGFVLSGAFGLFDNVSSSLTWYSTDAIGSAKARENRLQLAASMKF